MNFINKTPTPRMDLNSIVASEVLAIFAMVRLKYNKISEKSIVESTKNDVYLYH